MTGARGLVVAIVALLAAMPARAVETHCANAQDDDRDGFVDCSDADCVGDSGCDAQDFDGDGMPNGADCAPLDPARYAPPREIPLLLVFDAPAPEARILWTDMSARGYDVIGGNIDDLRTDGDARRAVLLAGALAQAWWIDARTMAGGSGLWLLARVHDECGVGATGVESLDSPARFLEDCSNGVDDDADGRADCEDGDCVPPCAEDCADGSDDDADGLVDCDDPDCFGSSCAELCDDGSDNDDDGLTDCDDDDCDTQRPCAEDCSNLRDDDGNGLTDCDDPACSAAPACCLSCSGGRLVAAAGLACRSVSSGPCGSETLAVPLAAGGTYVFTTCGECGGGAVPGTTIRILQPSCALAAQSTSCARTGESVPEIIWAAPVTGLWKIEIESPAPWTLGYRALSIESDRVQCHDGSDQDLDGLTDCADPDCSATCDESRQCTNGEDDDDDGLVDCEDPDCGAQPSCDEATHCGDGLDNDRDGLADCLDPDCASRGACAESAHCHDGADNDADTLVDCADSDCQVACREDVNCRDLVDNDEDGSVDCQDPDCASQRDCVERGFCRNGMDDDIDGRTDCDDPDCASDAGCREPGDCRNGLDDDGDGNADCLDADCVDDPLCDEDCANGIDDNADGAIDCADSRCVGGPSCCDSCSDASELLPAPTEACQQYRNDGPCLHRWLAVDLEGGTAYAFTTCSTYCGGACGFDSVLELWDGCGTSLGRNDQGCSMGDASFLRVLAPATGRYHLEVRSNGPIGAWTVGYRSMGHEDTDSECSNRLEDDYDGLIDCADPDCAGHGGC